MLIGLDLDTDNDGKVFGNRISKARTALRGPIGSFLISHNHFWQGSDVGLPRTDRTPVLHFGARSTNVVAVNYIDNGMTVLEEGLGGSGEARTMGFCSSSPTSSHWPKPTRPAPMSRSGPAARSAGLPTC